MIAPVLSLMTTLPPAGAQNSISAAGASGLKPTASNAAAANAAASGRRANRCLALVRTGDVFVRSLQFVVGPLHRRSENFRPGQP